MSRFIEEGRRDCPKCGGSNTLKVTYDGDKLLLRCYRCAIPDHTVWFNEMLAILGIKSCTTQLPARRTTQQKPTHSEAAAKARKIWEMAKPADPKHSYLAKKGIAPHGARQDKDGKLVLAARNIYGDITTTETIDQKGNKLFMYGGKKKGSFFILDDQTITDRIYICEGFATAASIQEATEEATICGFDAENLLPVAEALRGRYPDVELVICGDNDKFHKDGTLKDSSEQNKGIEAATAAARAVGGKVCFPSFESDKNKPTDFNDLHVREGLDVVMEQIKAADHPESESVDHHLKHLPLVPVNVFPESIQGLIVRAAETFGTTKEIVVSAILAIAGGIIGGRRVLQVKSDWLTHAALYWLIVAPTGESKSPVINWLMNPIEKIERELFGSHRSKLKLYEERLSEYKKGDKKPVKPVRHQLKVGDVTIEEKADILEANPGGILEFRDEASGMLTDEDKYHRAKGSDRSKHLEIYDRRPLQVDRKSAPPVYVANPSLARFGGIQPGILQSCFSDLDAVAGVLGRFICIHSELGKPSFWSEQEMEEADGFLWENLIKKFFEYDMPEDENGWPQARSIRLSPEAKALYVEYYNELAALPYVDGSAIREILPKAREHCLRLCLILHCLSHATAGTNELESVSAATMEKAITLARWVYDHNVRTWKMVTKSMNAPDRQPLEKRIAQAIIDLSDKVNGGMLKTADITEQVNLGYPEKFHSSPDSVGRICSSKLNLAKNSDTSNRSWMVTPDTIERLKNTFDLRASDLSDLSDEQSGNSTQSLKSLESLNTCENQNNDSEFMTF